MKIETELQFDNTLSVKKLAERGIPEIPVGTEKFEFLEGELVYSSGTGRYKAGVEIRIVESYTQNGYCYYVDDNGLTWRQKDLTRNKAA